MYHGLSTDEVEVLQKQFGKNALPQAQSRFLKLLVRQFKSVFIILLILASAVTFALGEPFDASFILIFVFLGIGLSLFQEYKSNAAADKLQSYLVKTITVRRNGEDEEVPVSELVPGDILKLESGDIVPADAVIRHAQGLQVDETAFTGESVPVSKAAAESSETLENNKLLQGTVIVRGLAYAEVTATGSHTRLAHIAHTASSIESVSELTKGVDKISTFILRTTLITLLFVVLANVLIEGAGADIPHLLIFAIALAVSVIPEALPLVMMFSLSHGALKLAKNHVIVKRLSAVQDLGSIELLCTDKTGTITENKLVYKNEYIIPECPFHPLVLSQLASHDLHERHPEPFDHATKEALSEDHKRTIAEYTLLEEYPFDPVLRSNGAKVRHQGGNTLSIRRGSPEYFISQGLVNRERVGQWLFDEERMGHRVLGVSYDYGNKQQFGGFVSFADTLKESTTETLKQAKELNVTVTIITGDSYMVAEAIGREVGLVTHPEHVCETSTFFDLPTEEQHARVGDIRVFARTTPEQKLSLISLLKEKYTVGFLGEGINDAAALKAASVSMVVQSASDVARETADIILLKSDLHVIIDGIRLGRETHANTLKYIRATLVSNFGNFYAVAIGSLFITFLPMLPKQLLLLNLLSDFPMMAVAFDRVSRREISRPQKYDFRSLYIIFITLGLVSTVFDFMWFGIFFKEGPAVLQTNWFIASVITEIALLFSIRSMLPIEKAGLPAPIIMWLSALAFVATITLPIIPITAHYFEFATPTWGDLGLIITLTGVYLVVTEMVKRPVARFLKMS
ncbi:HAD-IC family P-type ATPase [Candidatus Kaiserbacteria bacterium]|nr:MAG: HAD-IC family P-type ATPase [Candidatus Kaiserbacteria bacterium]